MRFSATAEELCLLHAEGGLARFRAVGGARGLAEKLGVDLCRGLASEEVAQRRETFGTNRVPETPMTSYLGYIKEAMGDFTLRLLSACAILSSLVAVIFERDVELSWIEGVSILFTVLVVCNIQAFQDWTKERSFRRLNADVNLVNVQVLRDGHFVDVLRYDLVVGDIVSITVGDVIEADGVLIRSEDLQMDESALTGEPDNVAKETVESPFIYSGAAVKDGCGLLLVTAVGINSQSGRILALIRGQKVAKATPPSPESATSSTEAQDQTASLPAMADGTAAEPREPRESRSADDKVSPTASSEADGEQPAGRGVLQQKLDGMVARIAYFAFASACLASVVMLARYVYEHHIDQHLGWRWDRDPLLVLEAVMSGIAIVVVAIPEGLPLAVTLALSLSMKRMQQDNNLVKHMSATETMGSATTICSDKTGTLTQNRMTVVRAFIGGRDFRGDHAVQRSCGKLLREEAALSASALEALSVNISATKAQGTDIRWEPEKNSWEQLGNKTDCALLAFASDLGVDYREVRSRPELQTVSHDGQSVFGLKTLPFSSARKRGAVFVPLTPDPEGPCRLYLKGASEIMLRLCAAELLLDGSSAVMTGTRRREIFQKSVELYAASAMRTIGLAFRDFESPPHFDAEVPEAESVELTGLTAPTFEFERGLTLLAVVGIHDPLREGVPAAVARSNEAGVDVRMVTGDHKATAIAVAKECNILRRDVDYVDCPGGPLRHPYTAMTGEEFRRKVLVKGRLDQRAMDEVWPHLRVLARSSPEDKHTLVTGIMQSELYKTPEGRSLGLFPDRQVVAVTGDGTNDAPALRTADVGFAMKIAGTRVAQDAADILILDDNFESVVKACMWGRNVYDSIVKFLQFQLTVNVSAIVTSVVGAVFVKHMPLSIVQMLWVNIVMDSLGALALASEPPTHALLRRRPYGRSKRLLSFEVLCTMTGQVCFQLAVVLTFLFAGAGPGAPEGLSQEERAAFDWQPGGLLGVESGIGRDIHDPPTVHYTMIFNVFLFLQFFNWINCRKLHLEWNMFAGLRNNPMFCGLWVLCVAVQVILVQVAAAGGGEGINVAFRTRTLTGAQWAICVGVGSLSLPWQLVVVAVGRQLRARLAKRRATKDVAETSEGVPPVPQTIGAEGVEQDAVAPASQDRAAWMP